MSNDFFNVSQLRVSSDVSAVYDGKQSQLQKTWETWYSDWKEDTCFIVMMGNREVFRASLLKENFKDVTFRPVETHVLTHPMHGDILTYPCLAVQHTLYASLRSSTIWKEEVEDSIQLADGCLKIYSEKSQISFRPKLIGVIYFMWQLVALLNMSDANWFLAWKYLHTCQGASSIANPQPHREINE